MPHTLLSWTISLFLLSGCISLSGKDPSAKVISIDPQNHRNISIVYSHNRSLELLPCGCSFNPVGGLDREVNLLRQWQKDNKESTFLMLSGGTTFTPKILSDELKQEYPKRAAVMAEALNQLGIHAFSPSADDLRLGKEYVDKIRETTKFPWVNANILHEGKPYFDPYAVIEVGEARVVIIGMSSLPLEEIAKGFEVVHPDKVLPKILQEIKTKVSGEPLIVLSSSVREFVTKALLSKYPEINVVAGQHLDDLGDELEQFSSRTVFVRPPSKGQKIARIDIPIQQNYKKLFSNFAPGARINGVGYWEKQQKKLEEEAKHLTGEDKKAMEQRLAAVKLEISSRRTIEEAPSEETTKIELTIAEVDQNLTKPENEMTAIVKRYKTLVDGNGTTTH